MSIRRVAAVTILSVVAALSPTVAAAASAVPAAACARAARPGFAICQAVRASATSGRSTASVGPAAAPAGYGPKDLLSAYHLSSKGGTGATVAVVDAYNDPTAAKDLATYRKQFGLPACTVATGCFRQVNQAGATAPLPADDAGWAGEESLALDMVSAVCAHCHILLVEATTAATTNLYAAEDEAVALGARYVSNSWGAAESSTQTAADVHFNHPGVAITAVSGGSGTVEYPGASRYVTAVGGTTLNRSAVPRGWTETAWGGSGSGCSLYDARPAWQTVTTGCNRRAVSDVAAVADPDTGVAVFQTYGASGWVVYGGGSVPPPIIAAVYALAGPPAAGTYPASYPYLDPADLYDITVGSTGSCGVPLCTAGPGWDGPSGLGTPDGTGAFAAP